MTNLRHAAAVIAPMVLLAGCSQQEPASTSSGSIAVHASDTECTLSRTEADAGTITFEVANKGSKVTEFYLYGAGDRIVGEVENVGPGASRRLIVEVPEGGTYTAACKPGMTGDGIRTSLAVKGSAAKAKDADAKLAQAVADYRHYVAEEADELVTRTTEFVDAVKAGKVDQAKALYPVARTPWERIEPVAESFGDLDPKIDGREDVIDEGMEFTGFHRLERDLWQDGLQPDSAAIADRLLADVKELVTKTKSVELTPLQLANGAKELLDEVTTGKITGEEDRYSHTDLWDFDANVDGAEAAIFALRPVINERDAALASTLDERFDAVEKLLETHRVGDGYKPYTQLTEADVKKLAEVVDALGEPLSKVASVVAAR